MTISRVPGTRPGFPLDGFCESGVAAAEIKLSISIAAAGFFVSR